MAGLEVAEGAKFCPGLLIRKAKMICLVGNDHPPTRPLSFFYDYLTQSLKIVFEVW